jgi:hypothetical protein
MSIPASWITDRRDPQLDPNAGGFGEGVLDAIDDIIQETFPSHSDAPTPNDINNAPGDNSPSVRDQTETVPTGSDPSLDPNNINNPGIPPFVPPDTAHRDPEPPVVTDRFESTPPPSGVDLGRLSRPSSVRQTHILDGDATGGGHGAGRGIPGKSEFPGRWSDQETLDNISDVVRDPTSIWSQQSGPSGSLYTNAGTPTRWVVTGTRDGIDIKVIVSPAGEGIITAFPTNVPRNP